MIERLPRRSVLALLASSAAVAACGRNSGSATLKVGNQRGSTKAMMTAAGVLAGMPYAVEWAEFPAAQSLLEAIGSGAVDMGLVGDAPFQFAYQSGSPIRAVGAQTVQPRRRDAVAIVVPAHSTIRDLAGLKGHSVATTRGSIGHFLALRALERAGLPADAVRFTFLAPGDAKAAFSSGSVDAWATWVPYLAAALAEGAHNIIDGEALIRGYGFEVANETAIAQKRALITDFLKREAVALHWAVDHVDEFAKVLSTETGLPIAIARATIVANGRLAVPIDAGVIADQRDVLQTFVAAGQVRAARPLDRAFEPGLL